MSIKKKVKKKQYTIAKSFANFAFLLLGSLSVHIMSLNIMSIF